MYFVQKKKLLNLRKNIQNLTNEDLRLTYFLSVFFYLITLLFLIFKINEKLKYLRLFNVF